MWQTYYTPRHRDEVLQLLSEHRDRARIMAGGTDLVIELHKKHRTPPVLIDITRVAGFDDITIDADEHIHIGPAVTHNQVLASALCQERAFPLAKACWEVGFPQLRNRATIAGNLVTASPAGDTIVPLYAMNATITVQSVRGTRTLTMPEFFLDYRQTALEPDELIVDITVPPLRYDEVGTFLKFGLRGRHAIAIASVAVVLTMLADTITQARVALGSVAPTVLRAGNAERFLTGKILTRDVMNRAGELAAQTITPVSDVRGTAQYRRYLTETLTRQALEMVAAGSEHDHLSRQPVMLWGKTQGRFPALNDNTESITHDTEQPIETTINGQPMTLAGGNDKTLLRLLRENANLIGTKEGCAEGECGSCTVFMDGIAVLACMIPAPRAHQSHISTIEGLADGETLHPVQQAFISEGAVQCGYCIPGFIMSGASLLDERARFVRDEVKQAIMGNLCRCTGYYKIVQAIEKAAELAENNNTS